ncbi:hypothetical protein GM921_08350 [Pedobacter sp. LMG 31464]|uniref:KTSC domain-containing protein n=1 Tax=Pedobacter planticolens TaxID=2679964 RepID=A0A923DZJ2_9SPHI|nr:hypothetical protein [Pedobacter planticolens]MBB2145490.1 hypothetical protein [Pedobacter planticolens]
MKNLILILLMVFTTLVAQAQNCDEVMKSVKASGNGTTYTSYNSDAISKVTFYEITNNYKSYYFAIVCFKKEYSFSCTEYIYQVASNTKMYYSTNYLNSAGKAFWEYIQPYNKNLGCAPNIK